MRDAIPLSVPRVIFDDRRYLDMVAVWIIYDRPSTRRRLRGDPSPRPTRRRQQGEDRRIVLPEPDMRRVTVRACSFVLAVVEGARVTHR